MQARAVREVRAPRRGAAVRLLREGDIVWQMVSTDLRTRYVGSLLGFTWSIVHPCAIIAIYVLVFSNVLGARLPQGGGTYGYAIYLCAGLIPWLALQEVIGRSTTVFFDQAKLVKNVAFPPVFLHAYVLVAAAVNCAIFAAAFTVILAVLGQPLYPALAAWPLFLVLQLAFAAGIGLFTSVLHVFFRDTAPAVSLGLQLWFWLTPIVYPLEVVPQRFATLLRFNPMVWFTRVHQDIVLSGRWPSAAEAVLGIAVSGTALLVGLALLRATRHRILDEV